MKWLLFTSQLPVSPSSLRVMVWRRMKTAGALGLQNGVWALPYGKEQERFLQELLDTLEEQGAQGQSFIANAINQSVENELLERCEALLAELEKETRKRKFTFAELEEDEEDFQKLKSWLARIQARDHVGGGRAKEAAQRLAACRVALETFAGQVYLREGVTPGNARYRGTAVFKKKDVK